MRYSIPSKTRSAIALILSTCTFLPFAQAATQVISIDPNQQDGLVSALNELAALPRTDGSRIVLELAEGTYYQDNTIVIGPEHSGTESCPVLISAKKGQSVRISGGHELPEWEVSEDEHGPLWTTMCEFPLRDLRIGGDRVIRARYPNLENPDTLQPFLTMAADGFDEENQTILIKSTDLPDIEDWMNAEIVTFQHWYNNYLRIKVVESHGEITRIIPYEEERQSLFELKWANLITEAYPYYLANHPAFCDAPGEWFQYPDGKIIYRPRIGELPQETKAVASKLGTLLKIGSADNEPVNHLTISGIAFSDNSWTAPNRKGLIATQGVQPRNYNPEDKDGGLVSVQNAQNLTFYNCTFESSAGNGLVLVEAVDDSRISGCRFHDIGASALVLDTTGIWEPEGVVPEDIRCNRITVDNNEIHRFGQTYTNGMGILACWVEDLHIRNNHIHHGRYTGIQVGQQGFDAYHGARNNIIEYNDIHNVLLLHDDGGAIYTLSNQPGTKIRYNHLHHLENTQITGNYACKAIYLDKSSAFIEVHDNLIENLHNMMTIWEQQHVEGKNAHSNLIHSNLIRNSSKITMCFPEGRKILDENTFLNVDPIIACERCLKR